MVALVGGEESIAHQIFNLVFLHGAWGPIQAGIREVAKLWDRYLCGRILFFGSFVLPFLLPALAAASMAGSIGACHFDFWRGCDGAARGAEGIRAADWMLGGLNSRLDFDLLCRRREGDRWQRFSYIALARGNLVIPIRMTLRIWIGSGFLQFDPEFE